MNATQKINYLSPCELAHFKIEGHLVVEAPAGPEKSVTLLRRALHINRVHPDWRIAVFCFNAVMANYLRTMLAELSYPDPAPAAIDVCDVYDWVKAIGLPSRGIWGMGDDQSMRAELEEAHWRLEVSYDALLVDEGQDATSTQIELYRAIFIGKALSFTIFFDQRQSLYGTQDFPSLLERHGFDTSQLKRVKQKPSALVLAALAFFRHINSEEAAPVVAKDAVHTGTKSLQAYVRLTALAKSLAQKALSLIRQIQNQDRRTLMPNHDKQIGEVLELVHVSDAQALVDSILAKVNALAGALYSYGDIAILLPDRWYSPGLRGANYDRLRQSICEAFEKSGIPYTYLDKSVGHTCAEGAPPTFSDNRRTADLRLNTVKVMTIHSSKGYHARFAIIAGFDGIDGRNKRAQLGYVALTRASDRCVAYFASANESVNVLKAVLSQSG